MPTNIFGRLFLPARNLNRFLPSWNLNQLFSTKYFLLNINCRGLYYRRWDQTNLVLKSIEKVKPGFLLSSICMLPESNGIKFWSHSFHLLNSGMLQTRMDQSGIPWKLILTFFKYKNEYHKHKQSSKSRWKNGFIYLVSFFPSWVMILKLARIVHLLQICADSARNLKLSKQFVYIHLKGIIMLF